MRSITGFLSVIGVAALVVLFETGGWAASKILNALRSYREPHIGGALLEPAANHGNNATRIAGFLEVDIAVLRG